MNELPVQTLCIPADHPVLAGHFPGRPIVPGVMLLEWVWDHAALVLARDRPSLRFRQVKFLAPLLPEQQAQLRLEVRGNRCDFSIQRDGVTLATGVVEGIE